MLRLLGSYQGPKRADIFIKCAVAEQATIIEELRFRQYVTDSIRLQAEQKYIPQRWIDMVSPHSEKEIDPNEIVKKLVEKAGLVVKHNESA